MNKVVTINLGGTAYQLEEAAYDALREYMNAARAALAGNPDKEEVASDLESAIASKCSALLSPAKSVVTAREMDAILKEMGPVDGAAEKADEASKGEEERRAPRRLYRLEEGKMIFGVCAGLAAYFDVDVTLVRILFVVLAMLTSGGFILAYFIMMLLIPEAGTPEERAAAHGTVPLTAQELVNRARKSYHDFKGSKEWRQWKENLRAEKRRRKAQARAYSYQYNAFYRRSWVGELVGNLIALVWLGLIAAGAWWGYHHIPVVHDFFNAANAWLERHLHLQH